MNISMRWLGDYVKLDVTPKQFADAMTMSGSKVEGWHVEGSEIDCVVVGKIVAINPHPGADTLVVCAVDIGAEDRINIVTGAKNLCRGDVVPVALDGAVLPGGHKITCSVLRGVESQGMLCSLSELGLTVNDFPYADDSGIFVLNEPCVLGETIQNALGFNDTVVEFEITSNRPDCLSVMGLAREAGATFQQPFRPKAPKIQKTSDNIDSILSVEVQNPVLCPRYVARVVTDVKIAPSPRWMRERLRASGVRPINNIVDITNFVMLEYGQPMHAFDIRHVSQSKIVVRNALPGETLVTLDGNSRSLTADMLVIADAQKPSAIAGIMGGEFSGINADTTTVVFESANFLGTGIRSTSRKIGLRTESSSRFEKGLDPCMCLTAADRACELVELLKAGSVVKGSIDVNNADYTPVGIPLDTDWINGFLGLEIPCDRMEEILRSLDFSVENGVATPPSYRMDVAHKADLAEEIARFYGYNNIPSKDLSGSVYGLVTPRQKRENLVVETLVAQGFFEICTYTFLSPKVYDRIRIPADSPLRRCVTILNPLGEDTGVMRTSVYPSMLEALSRNYNNRNSDARLFELAKEFIPKASPDELPEENLIIALGMYGKDADYFALKGAVETLLSAFGITDCDVTPSTDDPSFHSGRCARITKNGRFIATLGEAHPLVCAAYEMESRALLARIDAQAIFDLDNLDNRLYRPLPRFPASTRDIAIVCDEMLPVLTVQKTVRLAIGELLEDVSLFDCYRGAQIPTGKKSLAFSLALRASDRTLNEAEITAAMERCLLSLSALGAELRA